MMSCIDRTKSGLKDTKQALDAGRLMLSVFGLCFGVTLASGLIATNYSNASADTSANASVNVAAACTMAGVNDTAHSAEVSPGINQADIGQTSMTVTCNDAEGYAIYAVGYSGTPSTIGNTNLIDANSSQNIVTGTATSGNTSNWSMKLAPGTASSATPSKAATIVTTPTDYSNYANVPSEYTKVATYSAATDGIGGSSLTATYQAFIANNQAAGAYNGKVKYVLVHPGNAPAPFEPQPVVTNPGYISYNTNAPTAETPDTMSDQAIATTDTSATLWASNFQRSGYGFAGWNTAPDYSGTSYGPNETISFTAGQYSGDNPGLSLYAMWIPSAGTLQDFTTTQCNTLTKANEATNILTQSLTALTDTRDNNTYAVARLADGNCWMIENLRLADKKPDNTPITLNASNTNNPISSFTQLGASQDLTVTAWCDTASSACNDQSMLFTGNTTNPVANMTASDTSTAVYSYGNYYNWYSATAGNGTYSTGSSVVTNGDICPNGWHLPYGGSGTGTKGGNTSGGFFYLGRALGATTPGAASSNIWRGYPQNFVYSSYVYGSSVYNRSSDGYYWSSTAYNNNNAYTLRFVSRNLFPGTNDNYKSNGSMARCTVFGS